MGIQWLWVAVAAGTGILVTPRQGLEPDWLRSDGRDWDRLSLEAKHAYLAGFLAGSATTQALDAGARDSTGLFRALDSLERTGFRFRFAPNVYGARLADYYWWENQRSHPMWYALTEVNRGLNQGTDSAR